MDSYTIYENLSIRWDKNPAPANQGKILYHIETEPITVDSVLGSAQSPHVYRIFGADKKPTEIRLGNFFVEGSVLTEQEQGIYRTLKFFITDSNGDKEERSITFSGAHDGGFVLKVPAVLNELKELQVFGTWKNKTLVNSLRLEIENLKKENESLQTQVLQYEATVLGLQNEVKKLQTIQTAPPLPPIENTEIL